MRHPSNMAPHGNASGKRQRLHRGARVSARTPHTLQEPRLRCVTLPCCHGHADGWLRRHAAALGVGRLRGRPVNRLLTTWRRSGSAEHWVRWLIILKATSDRRPSGPQFPRARTRARAGQHALKGQLRMCPRALSVRWLRAVAVARRPMLRHKACLRLLRCARWGIACSQESACAKERGAHKCGPCRRPWRTTHRTCRRPCQSYGT